MKKGLTADSDFILNGDKSLVVVERWTRELLKRERYNCHSLPQEARDWFLEVVFDAYQKAENDLMRRMMMVKIIHTLEVVKAGMDILEAEKGFVWNEGQAAVICLLHDIARFKQALLGSLSDSITSFDHAVIGAEMIEGHAFVDFGRLRIDKKVVVEAVRYHSAKIYDGSDQYAKFIRDADKLALLRAMPEILAAELGEYQKEGVTENIWKSYREGGLMDKNDIKTEADLLLTWFTWDRDFNFDETKRRFEDEGIKKRMIEELLLRGVKL